MASAERASLTVSQYVFERRTCPTVATFRVGAPVDKWDSPLLFPEIETDNIVDFGVRQWRASDSLGKIYCNNDAISSRIRITPRLLVDF